MRIAILTQPLAINYGGIMQAFALQKTLRDLGHEVVTLDIRSEYKSPRFFSEMKSFAGSLVRLVTKGNNLSSINWPYNTRKRNKNEITKVMSCFAKENILMSPVLLSESQIKAYCDDHKIEAFIVGSDQVWRPRYNGKRLPWMFLSFLPKDTNAKRIAYAASFGTDKWEYTNEQTKVCKELVSRFDVVSTRELSGVDLCRNYLGVPAIQVLDPTLLLKSEQYQSLVNKERTYNVEGKIFAYVLDKDESTQKAIHAVQSLLNKEVLPMYGTLQLSPYLSKQEALRRAPDSVEQWLRSFDESDFVVTDSFHGTVFSIIHHKPFVVIGNEDKGLTRIKTLLDIFGLQNRLFDGTNAELIVRSPIDWDSVEEHLNKRRESSVNYLINSLI